MRQLLFLIGVLALGCSNHQSIKGTILDRNGEPIERVVVGLEPGNVELITDEYGQFTIDYLRDEAGERVRLDKRSDYEVSFFKPGFHNGATSFYFKRGELILEPISMIEDTIRVEAGQENIDPGLYPDRAQNNGAAYEGE